MNSNIDKSIRELKNKILKYSFKYCSYFGCGIKYLEDEYLIKHGNTSKIHACYF